MRAESNGFLNIPNVCGYFSFSLQNQFSSPGYSATLNSSCLAFFNQCPLTKKPQYFVCFVPVLILFSEIKSHQNEFMNMGVAKFVCKQINTNSSAAEPHNH